MSESEYDRQVKAVRSQPKGKFFNALTGTYSDSMSLPYKCPRCGTIWLEDIPSGNGCDLCIKPVVKHWPREKTMAMMEKQVADKITPEYAAELILAEYKRARIKFNPMRGPHEGYAVILEELDELWDDIKANRIDFARKEAMQVAAMALAFMVEVISDNT